MPCSTVRPKQTKEERAREVEGALADLEEALRTLRAKVVVGPQGAVAFDGWAARAGVTDVCAYRALAARRSPVLARAVAEAEVRAGRRVSAREIAAGTHRHGSTWHGGH